MGSCSQSWQEHHVARITRSLQSLAQNDPVVAVLNGIGGSLKDDDENVLLQGWSLAPENIARGTIFAFYSGLIDLQRSIHNTSELLAKAGGDLDKGLEDVSQAMEHSAELNMELISFFFKLLVRTTLSEQKSVAVSDIDDKDWIDAKQKLHTIQNLSSCLSGHLKESGSMDRLRFSCLKF